MYKYYRIWGIVICLWQMTHNSHAQTSVLIGFSVERLRQMELTSKDTTTLFQVSRSMDVADWKLDPNDAITPDDGFLTIVTRNKKRLKRIITGSLYPEMFGAIGDGKTDDTEAWKRLLKAMAYFVKADQPSAYSSAELGFPCIDLRGKAYLINDELVLTKVQGKTIGQFTIKNGTFYIGDQLKSAGKFLFKLVNAENIDFESILIYGKANDIKGRKAFYVDNVGVSIKFNKVRAFEIETFLKTEENTYDITVSDCYIRNYGKQESPCFVEIFGDTFINNNYFINAKTPLRLYGGNNLIRGNHFYDVKGFYGIDIVNTSIGDIISHNYFDGCSIKANRFATGINLCNNFFQNMSLYTAIHLYKADGAYELANVIIKDNTVHFYNERTPVIAFSAKYDASNKTIAVKDNVVILADYVGGILEDATTGVRLQLCEVIDTKRAKVREIAAPKSGITNLSLKLYPSNILVQSYQSVSQLQARPNIFIYDNTLSNNTALGLQMLPITLVSGQNPH